MSTATPGEGSTQQNEGNRVKRAKGAAHWIRKKNRVGGGGGVVALFKRYVNKNKESTERCPLPQKTTSTKSSAEQKLGGFFVLVQPKAMKGGSPSPKKGSITQ